MVRDVRWLMLYFFVNKGLIYFFLFFEGFLGKGRVEFLFVLCFISKYVYNDVIECILGFVYWVLILSFIEWSNINVKE